MFWKYLLFETKLLLLNKKNWLLGLALILFSHFIIHIIVNWILLSLKRKYGKVGKVLRVFDSFPGSVWQTQEGKEIYANLLEQVGFIFWQRLYLSREVDNPDSFFSAGPNFHKFFDAGLRLNELRLELHEKENKGIRRDHIVPVDEILKKMLSTSTTKSMNSPSSRIHLERAIIYRSHWN